MNKHFKLIKNKQLYIEVQLNSYRCVPKHIGQPITFYTFILLIYLTLSFAIVMLFTAHIKYIMRIMCASISRQQLFFDKYKF